VSDHSTTSAARGTSRQQVAQGFNPGEQEIGHLGEQGGEQSDERQHHVEDDLADQIGAQVDPPRFGSGQTICPSGSFCQKALSMASAP
jgi:hypothetical protein